MSDTTQDYESMSDADLRDYVRHHPEDENAFHSYMDRLEDRPRVICRTPEESDAELRRRVEQKRNE